MRLFDEVQARTRELAELLEQQTATSDVLQVISSSPGELEPVFTAMLDNAIRICEAKFGTMLLTEGDCFRCVALRGAPQAYMELRQREPIIRPGPNTALGRLSQTKQTIQIEDVTTEKAYHERDPLRVATAEIGGARTFMTVPMLRETELVGAIAIYRTEVRPFSDKQVGLVTSFARPSGNLTGFVTAAPETAGKRLQVNFLRPAL